jgi:hypothetical protein
MRNNDYDMQKPFSEWMPSWDIDPQVFAEYLEKLEENVEQAADADWEDCPW